MSKVEGEPVYVYDMRRALIFGLVILTAFETLFLYAFFITGSYLSTPVDSQYIIGIPILLLLFLDCYMAYRLPYVLRLEFHDDYIRVGRGSKTRVFSYSDLTINQMKLESARYGTYTEFTISSKDGDASKKWTLNNVTLNHQDTTLLMWLEKRMDYNNKLYTKQARIFGVLGLTHLIFLPSGIVVYLLLHQIISGDSQIAILLGATLAASLGCAYLLSRLMWNRAMKTGTKIRAMMDQDGFKPKDMRDFKMKIKEYKERIKNQEFGDKITR